MACLLAGERHHLAGERRHLAGVPAGELRLLVGVLAGELRLLVGVLAGERHPLAAAAGSGHSCRVLRVLETDVGDWGVRSAVEAGRC
ncbi:MAG: hypothetical protein GY773_29955 [Actinomycetia bacterium]|nr:hypothetical protein [Actinomycetes bacterium]